MSKPNIEKIKKEIDKAEEKDIKSLFNEIKSYMNGKLITKAEQYRELAEKLSEELK